MATCGVLARTHGLFDAEKYHAFWQHAATFQRGMLRKEDKKVGVVWGVGVREVVELRCECLVAIACPKQPHATKTPDAGTHAFNLGGLTII